MRIHKEELAHMLPLTLKHIEKFIHSERDKGKGDRILIQVISMNDDSLYACSSDI